MKYVCLGYHDEAAWNALPASDRDALIAESVAYAELLRSAGHVMAEASLQSSGTAATLRFDRGTMAVTDGPFAETKEQLGGFMVLEANDLNHAIGLMSRLPCMRLGGSLEIRPLNDLLAPQRAASSGWTLHPETRRAAAVA
jgi:hypothetical protein